MRLPVIHIKHARKFEVSKNSALPLNQDRISWKCNISFVPLPTYSFLCSWHLRILYLYKIRNKPDRCKKKLGNFFVHYNKYWIKLYVLHTLINGLNNTFNAAAVNVKTTSISCILPLIGTLVVLNVYRFSDKKSGKVLTELMHKYPIYILWWHWQANTMTVFGQYRCSN